MQGNADKNISILLINVYDAHFYTKISDCILRNENYMICGLDQTNLAYMPVIMK